MVPRENKNNAIAKFGGGGKKRVLWYFPKWPIATRVNRSDEWLTLAMSAS